MKTLNDRKSTTALTLRARTAAELMTPNPVSINRMSSVREVAAFLTTRGISAAPVIDDAGRPIGVVSRSDILIHHQAPAMERTPVQSVMTPAVFCVRPDTPAAEVIETMVGLGVRRVFIVDDSNVLIGVVSALDVLRKLRRRERGQPPSARATPASDTNSNRGDYDFGGRGDAGVA
jgi:CBS domain-containing protein